MDMIKYLNVLAGLAAGLWIARAIRRAHHDDPERRRHALMGAMLVVLGLAGVVQFTYLLALMLG